MDSGKGKENLAVQPQPEVRSLQALGRGFDKLGAGKTSLQDDCR